MLLTTTLGKSGTTPGAHHYRNRDSLALEREARPRDIVFVGTRRMCERVAFAFGTRLGEGAVLPNRGSLSRHSLHDGEPAQDRRRAGRRRHVVARTRHRYRVRQSGRSTGIAAFDRYCFAARRAVGPLDRRQP